jgi:hypothetical protein
MPNFDEIRRLLTPAANYSSMPHSSAAEWVVPCSDSPYDFEMIDLMTCALEAAWTTAGTKALRLSEDDWAEMAAAISGAVDSGERDVEQLQRTALDALVVRQEILARDVVASSIDFELTKPLLAIVPRS